MAAEVTPAVQLLEESVDADGKRARTKVQGICDLCTESSSWSYGLPNDGERIVIALVLGRVPRKLLSPDIRVCTACRNAMDSSKIHERSRHLPTMATEAMALIFSRAPDW